MQRDTCGEALNPSAGESAPGLDDATRQRLGRHLQAMYEPVIDEVLDPRLAELLQQLDAARQA
jgi:hypothetical protein